MNLWSWGSGTRRQGGTWVRQAEHTVLRVVSLAFSLGSAHAIRWFFSPLDGSDVFQPFITWSIALGFGVLGYFVSRGLAHRMMQKERIRAYLPICLVVEFVEIFCNYALAASVIANAHWLVSVPHAQQWCLEMLTYVALSIIPLVSVLLAVVDMDLERETLSMGKAGVSPSKGGQGEWSVGGQGQARPQSLPVRPAKPQTPPWGQAGSGQIGPQTEPQPLPVRPARPQTPPWGGGQAEPQTRPVRPEGTGARPIPVVGQAGWQQMPPLSPNPVQRQMLPVPPTVQLAASKETIPLEVL